MKKAIAILIMGGLLMLTTTTDYKTAVSAMSREERITGTLTLTDSTVINIDDSMIVAGSLYVDESIVPGDDFAIGSANAAELGIKLKIPNNNVDGAELKLNYGIKNGELLEIGQVYGDGIIGYVLQPSDTGYDSSRQRGYILADNDETGTFTYSNLSSTNMGASGTALGTGSANTQTVATYSGSTSGACYTAWNSTRDSQTDWYLPSKDELIYIYSYKLPIMEFDTTKKYWTSSESAALPSIFAWTVDFSSGISNSLDKDETHNVRLIRYFDVPMATGWADYPLGTYNVYESKRGTNYLNITAYDNMLQYDTEKFQFPSAYRPYFFYRMSTHIAFNWNCSVKSSIVGNSLDISILPSVTATYNFTGWNVNLTTNTSDTLAISLDNTTKTINIALANATASKNTVALIQSTSNALYNAGGNDMQKNITSIVYDTTGTWDTTTIATGETATVYLENGLKTDYIDFSALANGGTSFTFPVKSSAYTSRDILQWASQISGCYCRVSRYDNLEVLPIYRASADRIITKKERFKTKIDDSTLKITSVQMEVNGEVHTVGTSGTILELTENPMLKSKDSADVETILDTILTKITLNEYRPFELDFIGDPSLQPGDWITIDDINSAHDDVTTLITHSTWRYRGKHTLRGVGRTTSTIKPTPQVNKEVSSIKANGIVQEYGDDYQKFADGTMVCWMKETVTDQSINTVYNTTLYQGTRNWTFPQEFISPPTVSCGRFQWGTGASWGTVSASESNTVATLRGIDNASRATGTNCYIEAIAIGKWK